MYTSDERRGSWLIGIIDIGSNSIRLVVYDTMNRMPLPIFNEKAVCTLGRDLEKTGILSTEAMATAFIVMARFVRLARAMKVLHLYVLATAAVRNAANGTTFATELEQRHNISVHVLSGIEEAELAAFGILCAMPDAHGIVADLGGGSLELVTITDGMPGYSVTLPLGVLCLDEVIGSNLDVAKATIDRHTSMLDWLAASYTPSLYAVGGAWHTLARICIHQSGYPLYMLDNFTLPAREAKTLIKTTTNLNQETLKKIPGLSDKRLANLPLATLILEHLLAATKPTQLVFSIYGMREGKFFKTITPAIRQQDPLIAICRHLVHSAGHSSRHGDALVTWMSSLFPDEQLSERRLRHAACLLHNTFLGEHPNYRAEQAFLKILRMPFTGLDHYAKASIALAVYYCYKRVVELDLVQQIRSLLNERQIRCATITGLTLRLVHVLTGGVPDLLHQIRLHIENNNLTLVLPENEPAFIPERYERRLHKLAKAMGHSAVVVRLRKTGP